METSDYINEMKTLLKERGFKKTALTWRLFSDGCVLVFNIQKSQWDKDTFYINAGIYFASLGSEVNPSENKCHVRTRLEIVTPEAVFQNAITWFDARCTIKKILCLPNNATKSDIIHKDVRNAKST